jgi:hypothetical protein
MDVPDVKRIHFTRSTDTLISGGKDEYDNALPDVFEQEPTEEWADILRRPSGGDIRRYRAVVLRVAGTKDREETTVNLITMFTTAWSLTDGTGAPLPIDTKGYDAADAEYLRQLTDAIWAIVEPRLPKF